MSDEQSFGNFMRQIRAGDTAAATSLVRRYEAAIRRIIRLQLRDARLRRLLDSQDICQSVLGSFFVRAALGQYEVDRPEQLLSLLLSMARHKLASQVQRHQAQRRDYRRLAADADQLLNHAPVQQSPSEQVAAQELLAEARRLLSPDELQLQEWRQEGRPWADIAREKGGSPDGCRLQLTRAIQRVSQQLGLCEA